MLLLNLAISLCLVAGIFADTVYLPAQHVKPASYGQPVYGQLGCCRSNYPSK